MFEEDASAATAAAAAAAAKASAEAVDAAHELPSAAESRRSRLNRRFSHLMDNLQSRVLTASQTLNSITGYDGIEAIKARNAALETLLPESQARVRAARALYKSTHARRAASQREVTTLLARRETWTPQDLERFTELYRRDHTLDGEVGAASEALSAAEEEEQRLSAELNAGILRRYHEEQIWSDRIRRASTWGTWGLMGVNVLLFLVLQFVAEPWKRRRLLRAVVQEEKTVLEEVRAQLGAVRASMDARSREDEARREAAPPGSPVQTGGAPAVVDGDAAADGPRGSWSELLRDPRRWGEAAGELYSDRRVDLRMRDLSLVALEGAVAGAAVAGGIVLFIIQRT